MFSIFSDRAIVKSKGVVGSPSFTHYIEIQQAPSLPKVDFDSDAKEPS